MRKCFCFVLLLSCAALSAGAAEAFLKDSQVWGEREDGLETHHVYGLAVSNAGTVLAFSEGRIKKGDADPHHIVLRRSKDNGATWLPTQFVVRAKTESFANPVPLVDPKTGTIFLFYALNHHNQSTQLFRMASRDDGATWSDPVDCTAAFEDDAAKRKFHLPGPGHGIALKSGRLALQVWHRHGINKSFTTPIGERQYAVSVLYSDDGGATWKNGAYTGTQWMMNESRIAELSDGRIYLNARMAQDKNKDRAVAYSSDGGQTWVEEGIVKDPRPFFPTDAGMICATSGELAGALLFSRPDDLNARKNMSVCVSKDGGKTWPLNKVIFAGNAFYSDMVELKDGTFGVLYGGKGTDKWMPMGVYFARFNAAFLKE